MNQKSLVFMLMCVSLTWFSPGSLSAAEPEDKTFDFTIQYGQGGFKDGRSPLGKLGGGGQITLDVKPRQLPFALSYIEEFYTNSPEPTHSYEIAGLWAVNLLYVRPFVRFERARVFLGGGMGRLSVPKGEDEPDTMVKGTVYNLEGGIIIRLFGPIWIYGVGKYLYARKTRENTRVIDFNEGIILLGLTAQFSL